MWLFLRDFLVKQLIFGQSSSKSLQLRFFMNQKSCKRRRKIQFYTFNEQKLSNLSPLLSISFPQGFRKSIEIGHWTLGSGGKMIVKRSEKHPYPKILISRSKFAPKQTCFVLRFFTLFSKSSQIRDQFFPLLFPRIPNLEQKFTSNFGKWGQKDV